MRLARQSADLVRRSGRSGNIAGRVSYFVMRLNLLALLPLALSCAYGQPYDIVIRNGHVIDGTGSPWYSADVGIRGGRIAAIGVLRQAAAKRVIDARGMTVAPGFI